VNVGGVVSKSMVSVMSDVVRDKPSRNLIYTVFTPSHAVNVCAILALHACRFHGLAVFQNATCTHHTHASVGHIVFSVTLVLFVATASLFILNDQLTGDELSLLIICVFEFVGHPQ
jgi:hypothetical protein